MISTDRPEDGTAAAKTGVEELGLYCNNLCEGNYRSQDLFGSSEQKEPLHNLLDRLQNRLGLQAVEKIACRQEHLPEYASYSSCQLDNLTNQTTPLDGERPFWLMPEPQPLGKQTPPVVLERPAVLGLPGSPATTMVHTGGVCLNQGDRLKSVPYFPVSGYV